MLENLSHCYEGTPFASLTRQEGLLVQPEAPAEQRMFWMGAFRGQRASQRPGTRIALILMVPMRSRA